MVAPALPFLKLFGLFVKTLSKPVATRLKKEAKRYKQFSAVCIEIGQLLHQVSSRLTVYASGFKVVAINPLPEEEAVARGINFISESFVFGVAGGIIVIEYWRGEQKNAVKAEQAKVKEQEFQQYLGDKFQSLEDKILGLNGRIKELEEKDKGHGKEEAEQSKEKEKSITVDDERGYAVDWIGWLYPWKRKNS